MASSCCTFVVCFPDESAWTNLMITVSPATEKLPYDPLKDLAPISLVNTNPLVLIVNPKVNARSGAELAALSKSTPGGLSYGTVGAGGLMQFAAEIFRVKTDS